MFRVIAVIFLIASLNVNAEPVMVGGDIHLDACGGNGRVKRPTKLYRSPNAQDAGKSKLPVGIGLFICSTTSDEKWYGVVVESTEGDCGVSSPQKKKAPYKGRCKSGWLPASSVDYLAG